MRFTVQAQHYNPIPTDGQANILSVGDIQFENFGRVTHARKMGHVVLVIQLDTTVVRFFDVCAQVLNYSTSHNLLIQSSV